ncbi:MAG: hypothetical protein QUS33_07680, partial [Dehalococcoidia bacterium]|nr:hypothetical protein [Dehalococcoidia bacterium]
TQRCLVGSEMCIRDSINTLSAGTLREQEERYGLVYCFSDPRNGQRQAMEKAAELLRRPRLKEEWREKRDRALSEKVDMTRFMVELAENALRKPHGRTPA